MTREEVYKRIDSERDYQGRKWGNRGHEVGAWLVLMKVHLDEAMTNWAGSPGDFAALLEVRKVAALAVACAEQHGIEFRSKHQEPRGDA